MVISTNTVAILDPHRCFLDEHYTSKLTEFMSYSSHASCFDGKFNFKRSTKHYDATLFRFPLRKSDSQSKIVDKEYPPDRVLSFLYDSFIKEAPIILLFLKYVREISLFDNDRLVYKVSIDSSQVKRVEQERQALLSLASQPSLPCTLRVYAMSIKTEVCREYKQSHDTSCSTAHHWLIVNMVGSSDQEIIEMSMKQSSTPWVGIATPLPCKRNVSNLVVEECTTKGVATCVRELKDKLESLPLSWSDSTIDHDGRAFCFLPLPGSINLPVNIHGYFSVSDNRRTIEWPADDNKSDKAMWNKILMEKHIGPLYSMLLGIRSLLLRYTGTGLPKGDSESITDPYAAWPLISKVKYNDIWQNLIQPVIEGIVDLSTLWTPVEHGKWVSLREASYFPSPLDFPLPETVIELLIKANLPLVSLPSEIRHTLNECIGNHSILETNGLNPSVVRKSLKRLSHKSIDVSNKEKVENILECILHDINDKNCIELVDLKLLPLNEEKFKVVVFKEKITGSADCLYLVDQNENALNFLPNINGWLVHRDLRRAVFSKLRLLAVRKMLQLRSFTSDAIVSYLLPQSIKSWCPKAQKNSKTVLWTPGVAGHPPQCWIQEVWQWLNRNCHSLTELKSLPLIPTHHIDSLSPQDSVTLLRFPKSKGEDIFFNKEADENERELANLLEKMNATVIEYNSFVLNHPSINDYIQHINIQTVLQYIKSVGVQAVASSLTNEEKVFLCAAIANFFKQRKVSFADLIRKLPIFETGVGANATSRCLVSIGKKLVLPHKSMEFDKDLFYPEYFLNNSDENVCVLLQNLGCNMLTSDDIIIKHVIPFALQQCHCSTHEWCNGDELFVFILNQKRSSRVLNALKEVPFVRTEANIGIFKKAGDLYDSSDEQLARLFDATMEDIFPHDKYYQKGVSDKLQSIGLLTWKKLIQKTSTLVSLLKERACTIAGIKDQKKAVSRSLNIMELVTSIPDHSCAIMTELSSVPFLAIQISPPNSYPSYLRWVGADRKRNPFETPSNVYSHDTDPYLVGAVAPVLKLHYAKLNLSAVRPVLKSDSTLDVVLQLKALISSCSKQECSESEFDKVKICVCHIYQYLNDNCTDGTLLQSLPNNWIWWCKNKKQYSFMKPSSFVWQSSVSLSPFRIYTLTKNRLLEAYHAYEDLFVTYGGVKKFLTPNEIASILEKLASKSPQLNEKDLSVVISIVLYLKEENYSDNIYLPTTDGQLLQAKDCTFDDREWIKKLEGAGISKYKFVHESIPSETARFFGVEPLSKMVAPSRKLKLTHTMAGPSERITRRIGGIVSDYSGNIDVFKELIQNADDSGASEVKLLLDWRHHGRKSVIVKEMSQWQGPALIAFNNATFTDQDFQNICELAAESKMKDPMKTGRFGVGFCACYSFTDVPSFVSRHSITIFDPHTKYLGDRVSHNEPGMRIDLVENRDGLKFYRDQFLPFDNLFGCHIFKLDGDGFNGTIFRFPFRMESFPRSEICNEHYDEYAINGLIDDLKKEAHKILLFLKNVHSLEFYELHEAAKSPSEMKLMFKVIKTSKDPGKSRLQLLRKCRETSLCSFLTIKVEESSKMFKTHFLLSTAFSKSERDDIKPGLLPLAELAVPLSFDSCCPTSLKDNGSLFCFLPLPLKSHLPFHINGFFDVGKDRHGLKEAAQSSEYQWNEFLVKTVLPIALKAMLTELTKWLKSDKDLQQYYFLWPGAYSADSDKSNWISTVFTKAATKAIAESNEKLLWSEASGGKWVALKDAYIFVDSATLPIDIEKGAIHLIRSENYSLVECPNHVRTLLKKTLPEDHVLNYRWFFENIFIQNINQIDTSIRDEQLLFILKKIQGEVYSSESPKYDWAAEILKQTACIPVTSSNNKLVKPGDLIDIDCTVVGVLYEECEGRFPDEEFNRFKDALILLGMVSQELPFDMLKERAWTVSQKEDHKAFERMMALLHYINYIENSTILSRSLPFGQVKEDLRKKRNERIELLSNIPCLLSASKPNNISIPWMAEEKMFFCPSNLYPPVYTHLLFTKAPLFHLPDTEGSMEVDKIVTYLGIDANKPTIDLVLDNLCELVQHISTSSPDEATTDYLEKEQVFPSIYKFLQDNIKSDKELIVRRLQNTKCVWQKGILLHPKQIVCDWNANDCYPYYSPLSDKNRGFKEFFLAIGVKEEADFDYLLSLLSTIGEDYPGTPLPNQILEFTVAIASKLYSIPSHNKHSNDILLPDQDCILRPVTQLSCDPILESEWLGQLPDYQDFIQSGGRSIHQTISRANAMGLGAYPVIDAIVRYIEDENFLDDTDFGQSEELVDRLNGILKKYPADISIFREFIQNADDAQATEIVFVLDHRKNHPDRTLITGGSNWASLQHSPALCIYNNRQFTENDMKGICKLGRGGKGETADTIGRFGIGFNVSYHLTDCPTFVSFDPDGNPSNLCVFDPLKRYCNKPKGKPGRRWKVNESHINQFPDQFEPFLLSKFGSMKVMTDTSSGFVVFRLPLLRHFPVTHTATEERWLKEGRAHTLPEVEAIFKNFKSASKELLLFLNNIKDISAFEIKTDGTCVHHFTSSKAISGITGPLIPDCGNFTIFEAEITHQVSITNNDNETTIKWLVSKISGFSQSSLSLLSQEQAKERGLAALGGVAAQIDPVVPLENGNLFCFLPLGIPSCLPVHLNAYFLIDDSRRHLETLPDLENWNTDLATNLLLPAYVELLFKAQQKVDGSEESIIWFYDLFPKLSMLQISEASQLKLDELLFKDLIEQNCRMLLDSGSLKDGSFNWLTVGNGLFCIDNITTDDYYVIKEAEKIELILVSLDMPITCAPKHIFHSLVEVSKSYKMSGLLTPSKVLEWLGNIDVDDYKDILVENCEVLLTFCLQDCPKSKVQERLKGIPLLLTLNGTLDFSGKLYESKYSDLLPDHKEWFVDPNLEKTDIGNILKIGNVIVPLTVNVVSSSLKLENVNKPTELSEDDTQLVKHLWVYLTSIYLYYPSTSVDIINLFSHMPILPGNGGLFYPPKLAKCLLQSKPENNLHLESALIKLGCKALDFKLVSQDIIPHFVSSVVLSLSTCNDILECLNLCEPNLECSLSPEEVSHFISMLSTAHEINDKIVAILKRLPIFETVNNVFIKVSDALKFYIKPLSVPDDGILAIQGAVNEVVLANPSLQANTLYQKIFKTDYESAHAGGEVGFYLNYLIPHISHLSESELEIHLKYIKDKYSSRSLLLFAANNWTPVIEELKKTPLILRQEDDSKTRELVSNFCDKANSFHSIFQKENLPPMKWRADEWLPFLRDLGLQSTVSIDLWLTKAKEVGEETKNIDKTVKPEKDLIEKAETLIKSLETIITSENRLLKKPIESDAKIKSNLSTEMSCLLSEASKIHFLYCPEPSDTVRHITAITRIAPFEHQYFISFNDAVYHKSADLSCMVQNVLPSSCCFLERCLSDFSEQLCLHEPINESIETVVRNLIKISEALLKVKIFISSAEWRRAISQVKRTLEKHYSFLEGHSDDEAVTKLKNLPCILLATSDYMFQLVKPDQLVMHLPERLELNPFCYGISHELMKYGKLLEVLGVKSELGPVHYVTILAGIKKELQEKKLQDDKQYEKVCQSAYVALVKSLRSLQDIQPFPEDLVIYLPSSDNQELVASTELVHNDVPWIATRLKNSQVLNYKFLLTPPPDDRGQTIPPSVLKVKLLSTLAVEKIDDFTTKNVNKCIDQELFENGTKNIDCNAVKEITETVKSQEFKQGLYRLYWHQNQKHPKNDEEFLFQILALSNCEIHCVKEITTVIHLKGDKVRNTEDSSRLCYLMASKIKNEEQIHQDLDHVSNQEQMQLYITHHVEHCSEDRLFEEIAKEIGLYLSHSTGDSLLIKAMFRCYPCQISVILDQQKISVFDLESAGISVDSSLGDKNIGSIISDPNFTKEDMIIVCHYKKDEKIILHYLDDGEECFKFAQIAKCLYSDDTPLCETSITVCIGMTEEGEEIHKTVALFQIYKILNTSQRSFLKSGSSSPFTVPLEVASVPQDEEKIEVWLRETLEFNQKNMCCSEVQLALRLIGHLHYVLVNMSKKFDCELFRSTVRRVFCDENTIRTREAKQAVEDFMMEIIPSDSTQLNEEELQDLSYCSASSDEFSMQIPVAPSIAPKRQMLAASMNYLQGPISQQPSVRSNIPLNRINLPVGRGFGGGGSSRSSGGGGSGGGGGGTGQRTNFRYNASNPFINRLLFPVVEDTQPSAQPATDEKSAKIWLQQCKADYQAAIETWKSSGGSYSLEEFQVFTFSLFAQIFRW